MHPLPGLRESKTLKKKKAKTLSCTCVLTAHQLLGLSHGVKPSLTVSVQVLQGEVKLGPLLAFTL